MQGWEIESEQTYLNIPVFFNLVLKWKLKDLHITSLFQGDGDCYRVWEKKFDGACHGTRESCEKSD